MTVSVVRLSATRKRSVRLTIRWWCCRRLGWKLKLPPGWYETDGKRLWRLDDVVEEAPSETPPEVH